MQGWVPGQDLRCGQANVVTMPVGDRIKSGNVQWEWGVDASVVDRARGGLQCADSHGNAVSNCELLGEQESIAYTTGKWKRLVYPWVSRED